MKRRPPNRVGAPVTKGEMPSREAIAAFIKASPGRVGKREIIRHFKLGPDHRATLLAILRDLAGGGHVAPAGHRRFAAPDRTHEAIIVEIIGSDPDGDAIARPVEWPAGERPPRMQRPLREQGLRRGHRRF